MANSYGIDHTRCHTRCHTPMLCTLRVDRLYAPVRYRAHLIRSGPCQPSKTPTFPRPYGLVPGTVPAMVGLRWSHAAASVAGSAAADPPDIPAPLGLWGVQDHQP